MKLDYKVTGIIIYLLALVDKRLFQIEELELKLKEQEQQRAVAESKVRIF
jgi:hypothetical protein